MKRIGVILVALFLFFTSTAQQSKMPRSLKEKVRMAESTRQAEKPIELLVKGDVAKVKEFLPTVGGVFYYAAGDICAVRIPASQVNALAAIAAVNQIEDNHLKLQPLNDRSVINNHAQEVHNGVNLPQGYDGKGVVVGIIDEGIEFSHPDFRDLFNKTRIKYLWDQTLVPSSPSQLVQPYNKGMEFIGSQIDTSQFHKDNLNSGHGTHVAGTAVGNGFALNNYKGMAPGADIIIVKLDFNDGFDLNLTNAVHYIFDRADQLGEPAVVNLSLGTYYGSHDGRDLASQIIDSLITFKPGRVVVAASGNAGNASFHLGYNVTGDTSFTWIQNVGPGSGNNYPYLELYADTGSFEQVQISIGIDQVKPVYSFRGNIPFRTINQIIQLSASQAIFDTIYSNGNRLGITITEAENFNGVYRFAMKIIGDSTDTSNFNYRWRFMTKSTGGGKFDAYSFDMIFDGLPDSTAFPSISKYKKPDLQQNMVSSFQCSDQVITVGAYTNRNSYANANLYQTVDTNLHPGQIAFFSSRGPTRDGRIKPDITAPGEWVLSCCPSKLCYDLANVDPTKVAAGGKHFRSSGTSMSCPAVAGICALYLQRYPNANWLDVKNALLGCAYQDGFTGNNLPNGVWGYGKADAYGMLHGCHIGIDENIYDDLILYNYPNPFNEFTTIHYDLSTLKNIHAVQLTIVDATGRKVATYKLKEAEGSFEIDKTSLQSGVYFYSLSSDSKVIKTNKLVVF